MQTHPAGHKLDPAGYFRVPGVEGCLRFRFGLLFIAASAAVRNSADFMSQNAEAGSALILPRREKSRKRNEAPKSVTGDWSTGEGAGRVMSASERRIHCDDRRV